MSNEQGIRFTYQVVTEYSVFADSADAADESFKYATEEGVFSDNIKILRQLITKTEELPDRGEKTWVWNSTLQRWDLTKYSLS